MVGLLFINLLHVYNAKSAVSAVMLKKNSVSAVCCNYHFY